MSSSPDSTSELERGGGTSIELRGVSKQYDSDAIALDNVSFRVESGEFMVLVGPSGCGKSTTLRLISGLEDPDGGEIYLGERLVNDVPPSRRNVAMVFQNLALYPHMSVFDNMAYALRIKDQDPEQIETKVKEAAELLEIAEFLERSPSQLSGGQRQRVAVGRELVKDPDVFLFDEPLSSLDARVSRRMRTEIVKIHQELKTTALYVTHDQEEAMALADRLAVMRNGRILQIGPPQDVYEHPRTLFVARFIGSPSMNLIRGRIEKGEKGDPFRFVSDPLSVSLPEPYGELSPGREVVLGIRPRQVHLHPGAKDGLPRAVVTTVELLGDQQEVHVTRGNQEFTVLIADSKGLETGQEVGLEINVDKVHLFDQESGNVLQPGVDNE